MSSDRTILTHPLSQAIYFLLLSTIPFYQWRQNFPVIPFDWFLALILLIIIFIHLVSSKKLPPVFFNNLNIWFVLFFLVNIISSLFSEFRNTSLLALLVIIQAYGFIVINLFFLTEKAVINQLPLVLGLSIGLNSLIASLGYFFGMEFLNTYNDRFLTIGATAGSNALAIMCVFIIPLLFYKMVHADSAGFFFLYMGLILINISGIISSQSRGGFLHLIVIAILLIIFNRHRFQPRFLGIVISVLAFGLIIVGTVIPDDYFDRQRSLLAEEKDLSLRRRAAYVRVGVASFMENPLLGTGTGSFPIIWSQSREAMFFKMEKRPSHNVYIQVIVDSGLIGLLIYIGLLSQVFRDMLGSIQRYGLKGDEQMKALGIAYLTSFLVVCSYGLIRNILDDKLFILILSVSQVFYLLSMEKGNMNDPV
jgi:putative inorganic carbon (hco3(-)) transporter